MAMDNFKEEIVVKRHSGAVNVAYYLAWVLLVISGIIGLLMLNFAISSIGNPVYGFQWQQLVIGVLFAGIAVLIWLKKDGLRYVFIQDIYRLPDMKLSIRAQVDSVCLVNGKLGESAEMNELLADYLR